MNTVLQKKDVNNTRYKRMGGRIAAAFLLVLLIAGPAAAQQDGLYLSGGLGLPELANIGPHYRMGLFEAGVTVGGIYLEQNAAVLSVSGDLFYHFNGFDEASRPDPWYVRGGIIYMRDGNRNFIHRYLFFNARVGRDFFEPESENFILKIDVGLITQLGHGETDRQPADDTDTGDPAFRSLISPSIGVKLLFKL